MALLAQNIPWQMSSAHGLTSRMTCLGCFCLACPLGFHTADLCTHSCPHRHPTQLHLMHLWLYFLASDFASPIWFGTSEEQSLASDLLPGPAPTSTAQIHGQFSGKHEHEAQRPSQNLRLSDLEWAEAGVQEPGGEMARSLESQEPAAPASSAEARPVSNNGVDARG